MFIDGIGIAGYRSFGKEIQRIGPFSKINIFIGKNNSGKSNILQFFASHLRNLIKNINNRHEKTSFITIDKPVSIASDKGSIPKKMHEQKNDKKFKF
ncbi:MAG: hypothetical protein AB9903_24040 [Vulcanimicrobiota bacterium]